MTAVTRHLDVRNLQRLLRPKSIALIGASVWTDAVAAGAGRLQYGGEIWRVHPTRRSSDGVHYYRSVAELPAAPESAFIAVPNVEVPVVVSALAARGTDAFVCFSSGFAETGTTVGVDLTRQLLANANGAAFLGPNCYGMVNFFDRVALWPDQVVGDSPQRGVALICQSGTIALTMMFNDRSVPIGYLFTVGNQTGLAAEELIESLCDDDRVSAFGLYIEGIKDTARFARAAQRAHAAGKPIALVKSGRTPAAMRTARSHTGALAGADAVFDAFCRQAGIARCETLSTLCETLKVFHTGGPLKGRRLVVMGASGGDMAMTADVSRHLELEYPAFSDASAQRLRKMLSDRVAIANPFDFHTYLWFDHAGMKSLFDEVFRSDCDAVAFMLDCPPSQRADDSAFIPVIELFIAAAQNVAPRAALIASLPETSSASTRAMCLSGAVMPLQGQREALEALALAAAAGQRWRDTTMPQLQIPKQSTLVPRTLSEFEGKKALAECGVHIPRAAQAGVSDAAEAAAHIGFPVVMKASSNELAHKSDLGGVLLNIRSIAEAQAAASRLAGLSEQILVEAMITDPVAEILVGVTVDPQFGQVLLLGAGGLLAELFTDTQLLLPPWTATTIREAVMQLRCAKLLQGFRGRPMADLNALIDVILGVGRYAARHVDTLLELDVNPVIVRPAGLGAVAVDALIRLQY